MKRIWDPYRDRQQDPPRYVCAGCGQEQYAWDAPPDAAGRCPPCRDRGRRKGGRDDDTRDGAGVPRAGRAARRTDPAAPGDRADGRAGAGGAGPAHPRPDADRAGDALGDAVLRALL